MADSPTSQSFIRLLVVTDFCASIANIDESLGVRFRLGFCLRTGNESQQLVYSVEFELI
jgi:hypothetical protein